jgi:Flp pilus assembly protein TadD
MVKSWAYAVVSLLLAACATSSEPNIERGAIRSVGALPASSPQAEAASNRAIHTDLIRDMLAQGQYYAALAHLEDQKRASGDTKELQLLEAEARRKLGQTNDAIRLYNGLIKTEYDGEAHHGLGLIVFKTNPREAVQHLRIAVQRRPTDAQFRNDLGYALMESGAYKEALPQLATAVELDQTNTKARNNLVVLLLLNGDEARARQVVQGTGISDEKFEELRRRAQALNPSKANTAQKR